MIESSRQGAAERGERERARSKGGRRGGPALAAALLAVLAPCGRADLGGTASWSPGDRARVDSGEVVVRAPSGDDPTVCAAIWVEAAPEEVWRVMVDCAGAPEFVPGMRGCRVLEEHGEVAIIEHRVKVFELLPELTYVFRVEHHPHRRIRFRRVAGALRKMEGEWHLERHRDGTLVTYAVDLDPGFAVPRWAVQRALGRDVPALLEAVKRRVEQSVDGASRAAERDE